MDSFSPEYDGKNGESIIVAWEKRWHLLSVWFHVEADSILFGFATFKRSKNKHNSRLILLLFITLNFSSLSLYLWLVK